MNKLLLISMLALTCVACERADRNVPLEDRYEKDNTGRNIRDRSSESKTSGDQSESEADRTITQKIRKALMDDDRLSTNAKNIKVITSNGVVTLRGPVANIQEKDAIVAKVQAIQDIRRVDNQLEVK